MVHSPGTFFERNTRPVQGRIATGLSKLGLAMKHQAWAQANQSGLSPTQGQILATLCLEGAMSGSRLAQRLGITPPTISDSVKVLVEKNLVSKKVDPAQARAMLVGLTSSGRALAQQVRSWPDFLASAASALSPTEQEAFLSGLMKMIGSLQQAGQIPTNRMCLSCRFFQPNAHDDSAMPHHCAFVDAPMAVRHLRIDCGDHHEADEEARSAAWQRFTNTG